MNRRKFLQLSAVGTGAVMAGIEPLRAEAPAASVRPATTVAMPISIVPLAKNDLDTMFADMRERAGVNALFPFMYSHEPHRAGVPPSETFHGGNYARPHMQYYKDTPLTFEDMRGTEFGDVDMLERIIPVARKHGIRVFCFLLEDNTLPATVPNWQSLYEVDHHGRRTKGHPGGPCFNNPAYKNFMLGLVEDYARSYDIGGIMWGSERQSGFLNTLSISQSGGQDPGGTTCFCEFCQNKGHGLGIDVERARAGYDEAEKFLRAGRAGEKPRDGYFATFWRLLMQYPEVLAWENLWVTSRHAFQADIYRRIKSANPALQVGFHVWQNVSFSPFQRAEENLTDLAGCADFIRPALYNNVAGGRFINFVKGAHSAVLGDLSPASASDVLLHQLGYDEVAYDRLAATGFSAGYVERETRRSVESVAGHPAQIWPGVDIDVPVGRGQGHCTPESVASAVKAAFAGGAKGIILSRNYTEMKPENLSG
ncbi:MAG TPA: twin-arginine translocation signal domain-containing protein, partial [Candidatus Polarisedimenticolia bacterium]|nr:twin-arginine translocation signal domain-containing protein [Candidatus Polarisedimenticolia bacterium]